MRTEIDKRLTKMSRDDLLELKKKIEMLLMLSSEHDKDLKSDSDISLLYRSLIVKISSVTGQSMPSLHILKAKNEKQYKRIRELKSILNTWLWEILGYEPGRMQKVQLYILYARMVTKYLQDIAGAPVNLNSLLNCKDKFPSIFENHYPGYLECDLGKVIFENKEGRHGF